MEEDLSEGWKIIETKYNIPIVKKQRYLYVLNYEYTVVDGTYYYYQFQPQTSRKKCMEQKIKLMKERKYKNTPNRIFKTGKNGWFIEKYQIIY